MNDWLDVMLEEIARKKREAEEAQAELDRRKSAGDRKRPQGPLPEGQSSNDRSKDRSKDRSNDRSPEDQSLKDRSPKDQSADNQSAEVQSGKVRSGRV